MSKAPAAGDAGQAIIEGDLEADRLDGNRYYIIHRRGECRYQEQHQSNPDNHRGGNPRGLPFLMQSGIAWVDDAVPALGKESPRKLQDGGLKRPDSAQHDSDDSDVAEGAGEGLLR